MIRLGVYRGIEILQQDCGDATLSAEDDSVLVPFAGRLFYLTELRGLIDLIFYDEAFELAGNERLERGEMRRRTDTMNDPTKEYLKEG